MTILPPSLDFIPFEVWISDVGFLLFLGWVGLG